MRNIACLGLLLALMSSAALSQSQGPSSAALESLDAVIAKEVSSDAVGGVTVGVVVGRNLVWTKSYGEADSENHIPAQQETVYRIGSITKHRPRYNFPSPCAGHPPFRSQLLESAMGAIPLVVFNV